MKGQPHTGTRSDTDESAVRSLVDRAEVVDALNRLAGALDTRDWAQVLSALTDEVEVDLSAVRGSEPETFVARELVRRLQASVSGLDATQHLLTNPVVDGLTKDPSRRYRCDVYLYAKHYLLNYRGGNSWTFGGRCSFELVQGPGGWRVCRAGVVMFWGEGNEQISELAKTRYAAGMGGQFREKA